MSWANCGTDDDGRPIGYAHEAICDVDDCDKAIDRGLAYACGGMHGEGCLDDGTGYCARYFCYAHLSVRSVCFECEAAAEAVRADETTADVA